MFDKFWISPTNKKYKLLFCYHCNYFTIHCPDCDNSSCNGGGCNNCNDDFDNFIKNFKQIEQYLDENELKIYDKINSLRFMILNKCGYNEYDKINRNSIDFNEAKDLGWLSKHTENLFKNLIK